MRHGFDWRWFPGGLIAVMSLVFMVNFYMIYAATSTFPGDAGKDGFDLSNNYDRVLATAATQAALGWRVEALLDTAHHPVLRLSGSDGAPMANALIDARAERPVGPTEVTALRFAQAEGGAWVADSSLDHGQWDVLLTVHTGDRSLSATRRLVVP